MLISLETNPLLKNHQRITLTLIGFSDIQNSFYAIPEWQVLPLYQSLL